MTDDGGRRRNELPPELAELDRELRDIRLEERESFAPELEAELERAWRERPRDEPRPRSGRRRMLAAAAVGVIALVTLSVPPARASLATLSRQALETFGVVESSPPEAPPSWETAPPPARPLPPLEEEAVADRVDRPEEIDVARPAVRVEPEVVAPALADPEAPRRVTAEHYPPELEREGIGGVVKVRVRVDSIGRVEAASVIRGSGFPGLDRAALAAGSDLPFEPARQGVELVPGVAEVELFFVPGAEALRRGRSPEGPPMPRPSARGDFDGERWSPEAVASPPPPLEAVTLLERAFRGPDSVRARLGSVRHVLAGEPPSGVGPLGWRADAMDQLERAMYRDPDNPAPYLALGRIMLKQGLQPEARRLFENGLSRAEAISDGSAIRAELNVELAMVHQRSWLAHRRLGTVDGSVAGPSCPRLGVQSGTPSFSTLIGLNYLCPEELHAWIADAFRPESTEQEPRRRMREYLRAAIREEPGHPAAHRELLLSWAAEERWERVLEGARRFSEASGGHPHAELLLAIALHRVGRTDGAAAVFRRALDGLPAADVRALLDPSTLMSATEAERYDAADPADRLRLEHLFWSGLDPVLSTVVNERRIEHLARAGHALLELGGAGSDAWRSRVLHGTPDRVRSVAASPDTRLELWDYGPSVPYLTFRRPATAEARELTPEARSYLDDVRTALPGTRERASELLAAFTVSVAHRAGDGTPGVRVSGRVPDDLPVDPGRGVQLGLFLMDEGGRLVDLSTRTIRDAGFDLHRPLPSEARTLVVEVWDGHAGRGAAARIQLDAIDAGPPPSDDGIR